MDASAVLTSFIILLPLVPAACIYWLLTPSRIRDEAVNSASGHAQTSFGPTVLGIKFNVLGSTAVYLVILLITFGIYYVFNEQRQNAFKDDAAWLVEVPVGAEVVDPQNSGQSKFIPFEPETQRQLQVTVQPNFEMYGNSIQFWVTPRNHRFPKVTISLPNINSTPPLDLNDTKAIARDEQDRKMIVIGKQWIKIQNPYDVSAASESIPIK